MTNNYNIKKQSHRYKVTNQEEYLKFADELMPIIKYRQLIFYKNREIKYKIGIRNNKHLFLKNVGEKGNSRFIEVNLTSNDIERLFQKYVCVENERICYCYNGNYIEIDKLNTGYHNQAILVNVYENPNFRLIPLGCREVTGSLKDDTASYALGMKKEEVYV